MSRLPFTCRRLLAPMEGVTEPAFRGLVLERNAPEFLGGTFTEFARVSTHPLPRRTLRRHLGPRTHAQPVGLQLMGSNLPALALSAERAVEAGAPLIDLNFGCPAKGALRGCAGSALLDDPPAIERLVATVVAAVPQVPVTAKIRSGGEDDTRLEEIARAAENGGAELLSVHARTRREGYGPPADWERLRRAVAAVSIPVCGNGGIEGPGDFERMLAETGVSYAMVGRAALGDPWIFSGHAASTREAAEFLLAYAHEMRLAGAGAVGAVRRVKQLLRHWSAGGLVRGPEERRSWLQETDPEALLARLVAAAAGRPCPESGEPPQVRVRPNRAQSAAR